MTPIFPKDLWFNLKVHLRDRHIFPNKLLFAFYLSGFNRNYWQLPQDRRRTWKTIVTGLAILALISFIGFLIYP